MTSGLFAINELPGKINMTSWAECCQISASCNKGVSSKPSGSTNHWASSSIIIINILFDIHAVDCTNWIDFTFLYWLISFSQPDLFPSVGLTTWPSLGGEGHLNYYPKLLFHTLGITTPSLQQKLHWLVTTKAPVHVVRGSRGLRPVATCQHIVKQVIQNHHQKLSKGMGPQGEWRH